MITLIGVNREIKRLKESREKRVEERTHHASPLSNWIFGVRREEGLVRGKRKTNGGGFKELGWRKRRRSEGPPWGRMV